MFEVWRITFFCLTIMESKCMALDNMEWGMRADGSSPFNYYSENGCVQSAQNTARAYYNEGIALDFACRKTDKQPEQYVPSRRD